VSRARVCVCWREGSVPSVMWGVSNSPRASPDWRVCGARPSCWAPRPRTDTRASPRDSCRSRTRARTGTLRPPRGSPGSPSPWSWRIRRRSSARTCWCWSARTHQTRGGHGTIAEPGRAREPNERSSAGRERWIAKCANHGFGLSVCPRGCVGWDGEGCSYYRIPFPSVTQQLRRPIKTPEDLIIIIRLPCGALRVWREESRV